MSISHLVSALSLHPSWRPAVQAFQGWAGRDPTAAAELALPTSLPSITPLSLLKGIGSPRQISLLYGVFKASGVVVVPVLG